MARPIPQHHRETRCTTHEHPDYVCVACCYTDNGGFCDCKCHGLFAEGVNG